MDKGVCLPGTSEDSIALHRCHRTHRQNIRLPRGNNNRQHRKNTINAMQQYDAWSWHGQMNVFWANATSNRLNEVGLNTRFNFQLHIWLFKCPLFVLSKTEDSIVQTCMKMVQMDSLNFSDNFSYINYLIWSYGWISMNFRSFGHFLEFPELS